jgi:hypothetical protein
MSNGSTHLDVINCVRKEMFDLTNLSISLYLFKIRYCKFRRVALVLTTGETIVRTDQTSGPVGQWTGVYEKMSD